MADEKLWVFILKFIAQSVSIAKVFFDTIDYDK